MKNPVISILVLACGALVSCHDATPPPYHDGTPPQFDNQAGDKENDPSDRDIDAALADEGLRYEGPHVTLVYDDGGVLYVERGASEHAFYDIDGNARVVFEPGSTADDGVGLSGAQLTVNGGKIAVKSVCQLKSTDSRRWIMVTDTDGYSHMLVIALSGS